MKQVKKGFVPNKFNERFSGCQSARVTERFCRSAAKAGMSARSGIGKAPRVPMLWAVRSATWPDYQFVTISSVRNPPSTSSETARLRCRVTGHSLNSPDPPTPRSAAVDVLPLFRSRGQLCPPAHRFTDTHTPVIENSPSHRCRQRN